jgi:catechol 2,3-dioxygenase-like lactoylglutathione lyase family enzyme
MKLSRVAVRVPDLDRAAGFYERAFGRRELAVGEPGSARRREPNARRGAHFSDVVATARPAWGGGKSSWRY